MAEKMTGWKWVIYDLLEDSLRRDNHGNWSVEVFIWHAAIIIRYNHDPANPLVIRRPQVVFRSFLILGGRNRGQEDATA